MDPVLAEKVGLVHPRAQPFNSPALSGIFFLKPQ